MNLRIILFILILICNSNGFVAFGQQKITDFNLSNFREDGKKDWEMRGQEAYIFDEYVNIYKMEARHYRQDRVIDIKADQGMLYKPQMDAYLHDNVEIHSNDGASLFTDSLTWKKDKNLIYTDDQVRLARNAFEVNAQGMNADTQLEKVDFQKEVTVHIQNETASSPIIIQSQGPLEVDYQQGVAIFQEQVRVESEQGVMYSDVATIFFNNEQQTILRIVAEGNVKIVKGENVTLADKAIYLNEGQKLVLEGNPHLILFPDEITGN